MADTVRFLMEEMIPELEELESKGYFSRSEVKAIAQKRQDFEYSLKRRAALKRDFLRYIEYESKLDQLLRLRKKERGIKKVKKGLAELGPTRRIHFIYERATRKFKADLSLWLAWLDFCKRSKSTKQFSKVVTKALHRHSHVPLLWVEAAVWDFERSANVAGARALMQQGLRHCPRDEGLWAEYLRLELLYVARLRARRAVLGLPNPDTVEEVAATAVATRVKRKRAAGAETAAATTALGETAAEGDGPEPRGASSTADAAGADVEAATRGVLTGAVARAVVRGAITAAPTTLSLRTQLLTVLADFSFPGVSQLRDLIYEGITADFPADPEALDVCARRFWNDGLAKRDAAHVPPPWRPDPAPASQPDSTLAVEAAEGSGGGWGVDPGPHRACCEAYVAALKALPQPRMHELFLRYLGQRVLPVLRAATSAVTPAEVAAAARAALPELGAQLLAAHQAALGAKCASEATCAAYVDWAMALGQPKVAIKAARSACDAHPASLSVWSRRLTLERELHARRGGSPTQLVDALGGVLSAVPAQAAHDLWAQALAAVPPGAPGHDRLVSLLVTRLSGCSKGPTTGGMGAVVGALLRTTHRVLGLTPARRLLAQLLKLPPSGGDMFRAAIEVEMGELTADSNTGDQAGGRQAVKALFEAAVDAYGATDVDLWLEYARWEGAGGAKGIGAIYWRATKALADPDEFVQRYRQQQAAAAATVVA